MAQTNNNRDSSTIVLYVLAALLIGVGGAWLFLNNRESVEEPPPVAVDTTLDSELSAFDALPAYDTNQTLELAELAMQAGQLVEPQDGSAIFFYRRVLDIEPEHVRANEAMQSIVTEVAAQAETALAAEDYASLGILMEALALADEFSPPYVALRDAVADRIDAKLVVVDGAMRRGQIVPAEALLGEVATMPGVDEAAIASRRTAIAELQAPAPERARTDDKRTVDGQIDDPTDSPAPLAGVVDETGTGSIVVDTVAAEVSAQVGVSDGLVDIEANPDVLADEPVEEIVEKEDPIVAVLALAAEALEQGRLVMPQDDNAYHYFEEARRLEPGNEVVAAGLHEVMLGVNRRAISAAADRRWDEADRWLQQADSLAYDVDLVDRTRARVLGARIGAEAERLIPVTEFKTRKIVRPRFPVRALRNDVAGWAMLTFTIQEDGTTNDIEVVETSERYGDQFGRAAEHAVEKWKFEPREFMGQIIAARTRTRVKFEIAR